MHKWIVVLSFVLSIGLTVLARDQPLRDGSLSEAGGRWKVIYSDEVKTISFDTQTIKFLSNDLYQIWVKEDSTTLLKVWMEGTSPDGFLYKVHYTFFEINCKTLGTELIKESYTRGSEYFTRTLGHNERSYKEPVPELFEESLAIKYCQCLKNLRN